MKTRFLPIVLLAAAGCGSSPSETTQNADTVTLNAASYRLGSAGRFEARDASAETVTVVTQGGQTLVLRDGEDTLFEGWSDYSNGGGHIAFYRESSTGETAVVRAIGPADGGLNTTEYMRLAPTQMPTTGAMTYGGEYLGIVSEAGTRQIMDGIFGTVTMRADFADASVTGAVTDRTSALSGSALPDAVFDLGRINKVGHVSGIIEPTSLQIDDNDFYVDGIFKGVISGANAQEVGGSVHLHYDSELTDVRLIEFGVFVAENE